MKHSFSTLGCPLWDFEMVVAKAKEMGFEGIEIRGINGEMKSENIPQLFSENKKVTQALLAEHGVHLVGLGTSVKFHDEELYEKAIEEGKKSIDICTHMNIPFIRVFGDKIPIADERDLVIKRVIKGIEELCLHAKGKNVDVLLEVHGEFNTIENISAVLEGLQEQPQFGIIWDIAHSDKVYGDNWLEFYHAIKQHIRHVHIKDHKRQNGQFHLCLVGKGDIPIAKIIKQLQADHFSGYYSLEWEKKWHPELEEPEIAMEGYKAFMNQFLI